jgi:hypothetical protein
MDFPNSNPNSSLESGSCSSQSAERDMDQDQDSIILRRSSLGLEETAGAGNAKSKPKGSKKDPRLKPELSYTTKLSKSRRMRLIKTFRPVIFKVIHLHLNHPSIIKQLSLILPCSLTVAYNYSTMNSL